MRDAEAVGADVASAVLRRYASLGKNGKPQPGEYTLLAGFAVTDGDGPPRVVAIGTGTKCLRGVSVPARGSPGGLSRRGHRATRLLRFAYDSSIVSSRPTDPRDRPAAHLERDTSAVASDANATHPARLPPSTGDPAAPHCSRLRAETPLSSRSPSVPDAAVPRPEAPPASKRAKTTSAGGGARVSPARSSSLGPRAPTPSSASNHRRSARLDSNPDEDAHVVHELQR